MIVDTHAHLCDPAFDADRASVLARAGAAGIVRVICVGEDLADARKNLALATEHREILPAAGLYPGRLEPREAEALIELIRKEHRRLAAIGEVGLDHWIVKGAPEQKRLKQTRPEQEPRAQEPREQDEVPALRERQRELFLRFVDLAIELDLPLNVHSRSAGRETIAALLDRGARRVQLHAFDGKAATALPAVEAGYFFSIPPSVVRSRQKQKLVGHLPLSSLLLESDSPTLGPQAGERNEPANTLLALKTVAEIKGLPEEQVAEVVAQNTDRLYRLHQD